MSKDDTVNNGASGIPGYTANHQIPGSFELPLPVPTREAEVDEVPETVDPWATTWDTATWETPTDTSSYSGSSYAGSSDTETSYSASSYSSSDDSWSSSSDDSWSSSPGDSWSSGSGDSWSSASGDSWSSGSDDSWSSGSGDSWSSASSKTSDDRWSSDTGWETDSQWTSSDTTWDSSATQQEEEYSGWAPQGASPFGEPEGFTTDHHRAEEAHAATPVIDPDVAAAAREGDYDPAAYDGDFDTATLRAIPGGGPHADDLITARSRGERQKTKASSGVRRAFGLGPGRKELRERELIDRIARPLDTRKTIMVINTKGGGGKTLVTLMLASYLGRYRSGSVLAWDNNETEGTLGMRAPSQPHHRTVVDFLGALPQIATNPTAGPSDLQHWVREQRGLSFDVLASADDDEAMRIIGEQEFREVHDQLSRFYRMIVVDTGNNRLSPNWLAAANSADLLVFATSLKDDTSVVAAKNLDALVSMGRGDLVENAVCVISHTTAKGNDIGAGVHTREHFEQWVRAVVDIPYDPALAPGLHIDPTKIAKRTHDACMEMTAIVVDGL